MSLKVDVKKRSANFNHDEKEKLLQIIYKFKDVLENKKTDAVYNAEKTKIWERIALEFNAANLLKRDAGQLRKFYYNCKKDLRKNLAEEKIEIFLTGGGKPEIKNKVEDNILLSIVNEKTLYGLNNEFGGDARGDEIIFNNLVEESPNIDVGKLPNVAEPEIPQTIEDERQKEQTPNLVTPRKKWSTRRRPALVKSLTTSDLAEEYQTLLVKRRHIANMTEIQPKESLEWDQKKRALEERKAQLEITSLELEVEYKKEKLKKLKLL